MARKKATVQAGKAPSKRRKPAASKKRKPLMEGASNAPADAGEQIIHVEVSAGEVSRDDALVLPEILDFGKAGELKDLLLSRRGAPIVVDAGQVRRTGMQAVQILISAAKTWQTDGLSYAIANPTNEFLDTIALVGLSREHLNIEGLPG